MFKRFKEKIPSVYYVDATGQENNAKSAVILASSPVGTRAAIDRLHQPDQPARITCAAMERQGPRCRMGKGE